MARYTLTLSIVNDDGLSDEEEQTAIDTLARTLNARKQSTGTYSGSIVRTPERIEVEIRY